MGGWVDGWMGDRRMVDGRMDGWEIEGWWLGGWMDGWMGGQLGGWVDGGWMGGWMVDGWEDGLWMDGSMVGRMGGWVDEAGLQLNLESLCSGLVRKPGDGGWGLQGLGQICLRVHSAGCPGLSLSPSRPPWAPRALSEAVTLLAAQRKADTGMRQGSLSQGPCVPNFHAGITPKCIRLQQEKQSPV